MPLNSFAERLARVRQRFISGLESTIEDTYRDVPRLPEAVPASPQTVEGAYRRIHGLVGIGPTVGFACTGRAARTVENILLPPHQAKRGLTNPEIDLFKRALHALRETPTSELQTFYSR